MTKGIIIFFITCGFGFYKAIEFLAATCIN